MSQHSNLDFLKEDYRTAIETALSPSQNTLDSYRQQHVAFVQHANTTIQVGMNISFFASVNIARN